MAPQKGKQGTKGAKQIVEENRTTLQFYRNMMMSAAIMYVLLMQLFGDGYQFWDMFFVVFAAAICIGCFQFMNFMARPKITESNQIIDSGVDLNMEAGVAEHVKDVIILTSAVQVLSFFSTYFWLLWLLVPLKGVYYAWSKLISPWVFAPAPEQQPGDEKKQRKMERRLRR